MNLNFKKVMAFVLISCLMIAQYVNVYAAGSVRCEVTLTSEDGTKYLVEAHEIPSARKLNDDGTSEYKFEYSLDDESMTLIEDATNNDGVTVLSDSQDNAKWDASKGVKGYISIAFDTRYINGREENLLKTVSGGWEIDDSSIKLSNRLLAYTCQDVQNFDQVDWKEPSGNTFSYRTNFTDYAYEVNAGVLGACSSVDLTRGTASKWDLVVECSYYDNNILDIVGDYLASR